MKSNQLRELFRLDVDDVAEPYLWSDSETASYADDAQKMFCRLTQGIPDASSSLCTIDLVQGEPFADIDSRILQIRRIQRDSDASPIALKNIEDLDQAGVRLSNKQGRVDFAILGIEDKKIRWVDVPATNDTASLMVYRLPLLTIVANRDVVLEIPEQHHRHLLLWMKHLAYAKQDSDTYDAEKSEAAEAAFRNYCFTAKGEQDRLKRKTRIVAYGGI